MIAKRRTVVLSEPYWNQVRCLSAFNLLCCCCCIFLSSISLCIPFFFLASVHTFTPSRYIFRHKPRLFSPQYILSTQNNSLCDNALGSNYIFSSLTVIENEKKNFLFQKFDELCWRIEFMSLCSVRHPISLYIFRCCCL